MTQFHDMRDAGRHRFSLSVSSRALKLVDWAGAAATGYNSGFWTGDICDSLGPAPTLHSEVASLKAIKAAEDGSGDLVLRIAEEQGRGGPARLQLPPGSGQVSRTDLLERFPLPLIEESGSVGFDLGPWEIVTLRISR
jgi:alpha-mannosidase